MISLGFQFISHYVEVIRAQWGLHLEAMMGHTPQYWLPLL